MCVCACVDRQPYVCVSVCMYVCICVCVHVKTDNYTQRKNNIRKKKTLQVKRAVAVIGRLVANNREFLAYLGIDR